MKACKLYHALTSTTIITFLRDNSIHAHLKSCKGKVTHLENTYKSAIKNFNGTRPISYKPFKALKADFESSPKALPQDEGRIILEEVLLFQPVQMVTLLIVKNHSILTSKKAKAKRTRNTFQVAMAFNPMKPVQYRRLYEVIDTGMP